MSGSVEPCLDMYKVDSAACVDRYKLNDVDR